MTSAVEGFAVLALIVVSCLPVVRVRSVSWDEHIERFRR
jgi:hypothetical protein